MKSSILIYEDYFDEEMTVEEVGSITLAILQYSLYGEDPDFDDRALRMKWRSVKKRLDADAEAYAEKCIKNRENGRKGGRPVKNRTVNEKTERFSRKPTETLSDFEFDSDDHDEYEGGGDIDNNIYTPAPPPDQAPDNSFPTLAEVRDYCSLNRIITDPEAFYYHYAGKNWSVNGEPLTDWKSKLLEWNARDRSSQANARSGTTAASKNLFNRFPQREYDYAALESALAGG